MSAFEYAMQAQLQALMRDIRLRFERDLFNDGQRHFEPPKTTWEERYRDKWADEFNYEDEDY